MGSIPSFILQTPSSRISVAVLFPNFDKSCGSLHTRFLTSYWLNLLFNAHVRPEIILQQFYSGEIVERLRFLALLYGNFIFGFEFDLWTFTRHYVSYSTLELRRTVKRWTWQFWDYIFCPKTARRPNPFVVLYWNKVLTFRFEGIFLGLHMLWLQWIEKS